MFIILVWLFVLLCGLTQDLNCPNNDYVLATNRRKGNFHFQNKSRPFKAAQATSYVKEEEEDKE